MISKITSSRDSMSVTFGTEEVRRKDGDWDGEFPVEIHRFYLIDGEVVPSAYRPSRALFKHTLPVALKRVGKGWRVGATESWMELKTPTKRKTTKKGR